MMEPQILFDKPSLLQDVTGILKELTGDWELEFSGPIGPETRLMGDLEAESMDIVQFVVAIEQRYDRRDLHFEKLLMEDGRYRDEIRVRDIVDFLYRDLNGL